MSDGASPSGDRAVAADAVEPVPGSPVPASIPSAEWFRDELINVARRLADRSCGATQREMREAQIAWVEEQFVGMRSIALSGERQLLAPDETDIRLILGAVLPACPCCSGTPSTFMRFFPHSGIYQGYVHCSWCDIQVFKNARDKEEARELAIAAWGKRPGWHSLSENTSWTDGRDLVLLAHGMEVQARYCPGEWSEDTPISAREYDGAVWSCFDDAFQIEIEEISHDPAVWYHGAATHWRELTPRPAQGIETRSAETERLSPKGESPVACDAPIPSSQQDRSDDN